MKNADRFKILACIVGLFFLNWGGLVGLNESNYILEKQLYCGIVQDVGVKETAIKSGTQTDFILFIKFDKLGYKSIDVTRDTYYGAKVGQNICFNLNREKAYDEKESGFVLFTLLSIIADAASVIYIGHILILYRKRILRKRRS